MLNQLSLFQIMLRRGKRKRRTSKEPKIGHDSDCVDRISHLPLEIIRQIHCLLPLKDAARTSVLSHLWRNIWVSRPNVHLDEIDFGANFHEYSDTDKDKRDMFLTYVKKFLDNREMCEYSCAVDELFLQITVDNSFANKLLIKKWIDFAFKNNVKTLCLRFGPPFPFPHCFDFHNIAFSATTLVTLTLLGCGITNCSFILPSLRSLFLSNVITQEDDFKDLLAGCPRIEQLHIHCSAEFPTIVISNPTLKFFRFDDLPFYYGRILIKSLNLESLDFQGICEVEVTCVTTVKSLTLRRSNFDSKRRWMNYINKFPLLEELVIDGHCPAHNCYVSLPCLARLVVKGTLLMEEIIRIDAPKLKSLECTALANSRASFPGIEGSQELEFVQFHFEPFVNDANWYIWLRDSLESFAHSKRLSLIYINEKFIIFPDELTDILLPTINDVKNLELQITSPAATFEEILDGFIWMFPGLRTLSLTLGSISKFIEFPQRG